MATSTATSRHQMQWTPQPQAAELVHQLVDQFLAGSAAGRTLQDRLRDESGTRLLDWIDYLGAPEDAGLFQQLGEVGFVASGWRQRTVWSHSAGMFPAVVFDGTDRRTLAIKVESVVDLLVAQGISDETPIEGPPLAPLRQAMIADDAGHQLWAIERHGAPGFDLPKFSADEALAVVAQQETFRRRRRMFDEETQGFDYAERLIRAAIAELGVARTCDAFFVSEREYWQRRNHAAQIQKARQDTLGLGWANHDHHTYRSSREHFTRLIAVLELLGFECRERFYAGREAGWGAQVLEQPDCGIVIFADVDLAAEEVAGDFAHDPLPARDSLGTVGLWCRLHGEAFLAAGLHHLECQFDFDAARKQLRAVGVESMKPFTEMPYLKQAFTVGPRWPVEGRRIDSLLAEGLITNEQAAEFRASGALGSHLEILQRDDGYKGFNQTGINEIILETDPRRARSH